MSNRLEELDYKYKRYLFKKILKTLGVFSTLVALILGAYFFMNSDAKIVTHSKKASAEQETVISAPSYALDVSSDELDKAVEKINTRVNKTTTPTKEVVIQKTVVKTLPKESETSNYFDNSEDDQALDTWIHKYNQKKSYSAAIYIAKQYYIDKKFRESSVWAKRANQLDRDKEEAWLYYAKSVYALEDHAKAKKILNILLQYKKSLKAELLLSEWGQ